MINQETQIDLDYRIYNKPQNEITASIEAVLQVSRIKSFLFYKIIIRNSVNTSNHELIKRYCYRKMAELILVKSIPYIGIIISIISLYILIRK